MSSFKRILIQHIAPPLAVLGYAYNPKLYQNGVFYGFSRHVTLPEAGPVWCKEFNLSKSWYRPESLPGFSVLLSRSLDPTAPVAMRNDRSQYEVDSELNYLLARKAYKFNMQVKPVKELYGSFNELRASLEYTANVLIEHGLPWVEAGRWDDWPAITSAQESAWRRAI